MSEIGTNFSKYPEIFSRFSKQIISVVDFRGDFTITVQDPAVRPLAIFLKESLGFNMLMDLFGMDYSRFDPSDEKHPQGLCVVYIFYSLSKGERIRVKAPLSGEEHPAVDSLCHVFAAANWFEREAWDLFGIRFTGHPNLIRILCHNDFKGHALRKEYPADGYQRLKSSVASSEL